MKPVQEDRSPLSSWVSRRLISYRTGAALDVEALAEKSKISPAGIRKMESPDSNPRIDSIDQYVQACGKTLGEFFEPKIPPGNPRYDRYVHRVMKDALANPTMNQHVRNLIGLLSDLMMRVES